MRDKDGRLVVDLPPKTVDLQVLNFSRAERQIYKRLENSARQRFIELDAEGRAMTNYTSILAMLVKLRQCVDHPLLVMSKGADEDRDGDKLLDGDGSEEMTVKKMIESYARGVGVSEVGDGDQYALQVLKDLGDAESTPECTLCLGEVFDEVLLPCYHRGWVISFILTTAARTALSSTSGTRRTLGGRRTAPSVAKDLSLRPTCGRCSGGGNGTTHGTTGARRRRKSLLARSISCRVRSCARWCASSSRCGRRTRCSRLSSSHSSRLSSVRAVVVPNPRLDRGHVDQRGRAVAAVRRVDEPSAAG